MSISLTLNSVLWGLQRVELSAKSKALSVELEAVGAPIQNGQIDLSGIVCLSESAGALTEYSCNVDGDNNMEPISGTKAKQMISALDKAGYKLGQGVFRRDGVTERSVFIQSIYCVRTLEVVEGKKMRDKLVEVNKCSVQI